MKLCSKHGDIILYVSGIETRYPDVSFKKEDAFDIKNDLIIMHLIGQGYIPIADEKTKVKKLPLHNGEVTD